MAEIQSPKTWQGQEKMVSTLEQTKSHIGQDQVSGGVGVLCWLAAPVAMFYWNLPKFCNKVGYTIL